MMEGGLETPTPILSIQTAAQIARLEQAGLAGTHLPTLLLTVWKYAEMERTSLTTDVMMVIWLMEMGVILIAE